MFYTNFYFLYSLEAFLQIQSHFTKRGEEFEPTFGLVSITDGTLTAIGHLFVSSIVHQRPGPGFLAPWVYQFLIGGIGI